MRLSAQSIILYYKSKTRDIWEQRLLIMARQNELQNFTAILVPIMFVMLRFVYLPVILLLNTNG